MKGSHAKLQHTYGEGYTFSFHVESESTEYCKRLIDEVKDGCISFEAKQWHDKRSLDANAYFHVLVNKIAKATKQSETQVKKTLVLDYGTIARCEDGSPDGIILPEKSDPDNTYPYLKWYLNAEVNGKPCKFYIKYKRTHTLDSAEMHHLIEGTIAEAKDLGIETLSPRDLDQLMEKSYARRS